jgi:heme exporter protein C
VSVLAASRTAEGRDSSPVSQFLGFAALVCLAGTAVLGLWVTPPDVVQGELVRLIYIHPPIATVGELAFGVTAVASLLYLWPRTRELRWDRLAGASAEVGVVFAALTLVTGSIWGRPTWGVWWTWDARLTSTALLLALFLGYLALRRVPGESSARAKRSAIGALVAAVDVPIVHYSVEWWRTLHQGPTLLRPKPLIHGLQLETMLLGFVAFLLLYAWLVGHRCRLERLAQDVEDRGLDVALAERRAEGGGGAMRAAAGPAQGDTVLAGTAHGGSPAGGTADAVGTARPDDERDRVRLG